jgi:alpha-L-fucosidase
MRAATSMGMKEICLTAKHAGGFTLWPSKFTPYGIHGSSSFREGKGDILKEFVASAKRWNVKVCYYVNPMTDGYLTQIGEVDATEYIRREHGMLTELLSPGERTNTHTNQSPKPAGKNAFFN